MTSNTPANGILHHIEIYVSDLKRSAEFWGWLLTMLGYKQYQSWANGVSWKLGPTYLVFINERMRFVEKTKAILKSRLRE